MSTPSLDETDLKLIALLRRDARTPVAALARALGVTRATVQNRIAQLWVPIAILSPESRGEALALLSSPKPQDWLLAHMAAPAVVKLEPAAQPSAEATLAANLKAMDDLPGSARSVPQSVGMKGSSMQVMRGALPLPRLQSELGWV